MCAANAKTFDLPAFSMCAIETPSLEVVLPEDKTVLRFPSRGTGRGPRDGRAPCWEIGYSLKAAGAPCCVTIAVTVDPAGVPRCGVPPPRSLVP